MAEHLHNKEYDLVSAVYHASQGAQSLQQYAADAENAGDDAAAKYFREAEENYNSLIDKGKALLKDRL